MDNLALLSSAISMLKPNATGRIDFTNIQNVRIALPPLSTLETSKRIENINDVSYPDGIERPVHGLNLNSRNGNFRYDREFLLQLTGLCKENPVNLPPLDAMGLEPRNDSHLNMTHGGSATPVAEALKEKAKESLRINTSTTPLVKFPRKRPSPLDLTNIKTGNISAPLLSALVTARHIESLDAISYPEGVQSPAPDLNRDAPDGKFRYDCAFLLQFMEICKEKPDNLPPLDAIGLEPNSASSLNMTRGGSGPIPPLRQAAVGLDYSKAGGVNPFAMGNYGGASKLSSKDRFNISITNRSVVAGGARLPFGRPTQMQRTASQGGVGGTPMSSNRTRSKRGEKRGEDNKIIGGSEAAPDGKAPEATRKRLVLQPRTKVASEESEVVDAKSESESGNEAVSIELNKPRRSTRT